MTKFTYTLTRKVTRKELAKELRIRADQLDGKEDYAGKLYVDEKGTATGGVCNAYYKITGLKKE